MNFIICKKKRAWKIFVEEEYTVQLNLRISLKYLETIKHLLSERKLLSIPAALVTICSKTKEKIHIKCQ